MKRPLALGLAALALAGCSDPAARTLAPDALRRGTAINQSADRTAIAVIGDVPYGNVALAQFPSLIDAINADPKVRLAVHIGDIKSGSTVCSDAWNHTIAGLFATFKDPLVYAIGDNEWTDCHRANNGSYDPLERLDSLRALFFAEPGHTLGGRNMGVEAQAGFPENVRWVDSRVTFAALHIIGSNNGLAAWTNDNASKKARREAEVAARVAANLAWLEGTFAEAERQGSAGIALFFQADMWAPEDRAAGAAFSAHTSFVKRLSELAQAYGKPVLLVSGDSHDFRVDAGVPWFTLYGAQPQPNITQVIVDRSLEDDANYVRLTIDPRSASVFSWEQVPVAVTTP